MKKTVSSGKRMTTVILDGTECEVVFSSSYNVFSVLAENEVTVSLESGKSKGDDGVITVPGGESRMYPHMRGLSSIFITGSGRAEVFASNEAVNPFKSAPVNNGGYDEYSNPNLLINPDFKINQRGILSTISPVTESEYFVDRWRIESGTAAINSDGTLTLNGKLSQILENAAGTNVTASIGVIRGTASASYDNSTKRFTIIGDNAVISWAKLEYGSRSTPFAAPNPATELLKCQRYFYRIKNQSASAAQLLGIGYSQSTSELNINIPFPTCMRTPPTISLNSESVLYSKNGISTAELITDVVRNGCMTPYNSITMKCTGTFDSNSAYQIYLQSSKTIDFSAEL